MPPARRRGLPRRSNSLKYEAMPRFRISKDSPAYYLTSVTKDRLPVFRAGELARLTCDAIDEARRSGGFLIFAYVIMLDHIHLITNSAKSTRETHRFINGIISRRLIDHLENTQQHKSLAKLRIEERGKGWKHSLWQHHPDTRLL